MAYVQVGTVTKSRYSDGYTLTVHLILEIDRSSSPVSRRVYIDRFVITASEYAFSRITSSGWPSVNFRMHSKGAASTDFIVISNLAFSKTVETIDGQKCIRTTAPGYYTMTDPPSGGVSGDYGFTVYSNLYYTNASGTGTLVQFSLTPKFIFPSYYNVALTAPAAVSMEALNVFTCDNVDLNSVSKGDSHSTQTFTAYAAFGQNYERTSDLYISSSTVLSKKSAFSALYWYPSHLTAATGDFVNGVSNYKIFFEITDTFSGLDDGNVVASGEISGQILWNETPPAAAAPYVNLVITEISGAGLYAQYGRYIKGKSQLRLRAAISASFGYGQQIVTKSVTLNGATSSENRTLWPDVDAIYAATATDNHGATVSRSTSYQVYDYWTPELSTFAVHRCLQDGTNDDAGPYAKIEWGIRVAPLGDQNSKALTIEHPQGTTTPALSTYTASGTLIVAADIEHSYDIVCTLADDLETITQTLRLSTAGAIMDILNGGNGIAFGKVAELADTLEVTPNWDVILNTTGGDKINLVEALEALATAAGIDIHVQQNTQQGS